MGESERAVREVCAFLLHSLKRKYPCEICIAGAKCKIPSVCIEKDFNDAPRCGFINLLCDFLLASSPLDVRILTFHSVEVVTFFGTFPHTVSYF